MSGAFEPEPSAPAAHPVKRALVSIQNRVLSGLILALPIVLTIWIVYWLYTTIDQLLLEPIAELIARPIVGQGGAENLPTWWNRGVAPVIAITGAILVLYTLGWLVRSRIALAINWMFLHVPGVTTIYQVVNGLIQSIETQRQASKFKRVVLVSFPHPGMRSLGFVTSTMRDATSGKTILCVCVLTGVFPPAGFTLFVPEEECTDLDWSVNQTLQTIMSGGLSAPGTIPFTKATGPGPDAS